jgi:hypothetical protein
LYSITCHRQAPVAVNVVEFVIVTPYSADVKAVVPPDKVLVPLYVGQEPALLDPFPCEAQEPPVGVRVPVSELLIATVPAELVENEVTKDLEVLTDEIVIDPADTAEPL